MDLREQLYRQRAAMMDTRVFASCMLRCLALSLSLCCAQAQAVDVPMHSALAEERIDSKTCYGVVTSGADVVGYELNDLLITIGGKLVELPRFIGNADSDYQKLRIYVKGGITVSLLQKSMKLTTESEDVYFVYERSVFFISEHGKHRKLNVEVKTHCSP
jgi:hypothetical protein